MYGPYLTMTELKAKYPNEWILLANPTKARRAGGEVTGGYLILHAPDRAEFYRLVDGWDDPEIKHLAWWWTGEIGGDMWDMTPAVDSEPGAA